MEEIKLTQSRKTILNFLESSGKHLSAENIHNALKDESLSMGIATVYRNLNYLYDHGYLNRIQDKEIGYIYDANTHRHYHFKCSVCGEIVDVDVAYLDLLNDDVAKELGIQNVSHEITFEGICKSCAAKNTID